MDRMKEIKNGPQVLFFGRENCSATERILNKLLQYGFEVTIIKSTKRNEILPDATWSWRGDYIICFRSFFVIPKEILDNASVAAINFHPAPPEYPGSGCINFALYDEVTEFGVTAHLMNEYIDNGEIIEVHRFPITLNDNLSTALARTHSELLKLCSEFITGIYLQGGEFIKERLAASMHERWDGKARLLSELEALQKIDPNMPEKELKRVIRATYIKDYPPFVELHGFRFFLDMSDT